MYLLMVKHDPLSSQSRTYSVFLDRMNAPSSGSCAHQVAARYQPLTRFQFLCYLPEVPAQNRKYRALWSAVRHSTCILCLFVSLRIIKLGRIITSAVSSSVQKRDPFGHRILNRSGRTWTWLIALRQPSSNLNFPTSVTYIVTSL